jgi:hypothetical protein
MGHPVLVASCQFLVENPLIAYSCDERGTDGHP